MKHRRRTWSRWIAVVAGMTGALGAACTRSESVSGTDASTDSPGAAEASAPEGAASDGALSDDAGSVDASNDGGVDGEAEPDSGPTDCIEPATAGTCSLPADLTQPICKLSLTGCMKQPNPTQFAANAVYYEVNSPLWSDSASKTRALVLPAEGKIHVLDCEPDAGTADVTLCTQSGLSLAQAAPDTGKWIFPVGTVLIKNFLFGGKFVETRLLMHVDAQTAQAMGGYQWIGYSYAWNEAQTDATINPNMRVPVMFNTGDDAGVVAWRYPDRADCQTCHNTSNGGGTLGLEMDQMNRIVNGANQIDTFAGLGMFDVAPSKPYPASLAEPYVNAGLGLTGTAGATAEQEARSYLAVNCGFCHRPDYNDLGFDLRYDLTLQQTGLCGTLAQEAATGVNMGTTLLLEPGNHANSALWIRPDESLPASAAFSDTDTPREYSRMPQLATFVVDTQGVGVIAQWIDSLASCPTGTEL